MANAQLPPEVFRMRELLANDPTNGQSPTGGWEQAWQQKITPWDAGDVQPALRELLDERWQDVGVPFDSLKNGKALVAGCGRVSSFRDHIHRPASIVTVPQRGVLPRSGIGKDVHQFAAPQGCDAAFIAQHGIDTLGIDLSPTAVQVARAHLAQTPNAPTNVTFETGNFFDFAPPSGGFDLAFDYTFFCAITVAMRPSWGKRYGEVIRPGGLLICLAFPIDGDREGGPPFSVSEEAYDAALPEFEKIYAKQPTKMAEGRTPGRDRMLVYKRKQWAQRKTQVPRVAEDASIREGSKYY